MSDNKVFSGNLQDTHLVQKSEPLLLMRTVPFELGELKILDTYLSRINSHDEKNSTVTFTKAEYEELMGLEKCNLNTLKKYTKSMLGKVVELPMPDGYMQFTLFTKSVCTLDEYGQRIIELTCSEEAKILFFNIEKLGYLQYELKNVLSLTSKYSLLLYLYLRKERYRSQWSISLKELREQKLDVKNNQTYENFKYFKRDILDKAINEINEKTDIKFTYDTEKTGRRVTGIHFHLIKEIISMNENQLTFENVTTAKHKDNSRHYSSEMIDFLAGSCNEEFTEQEMEQIFQILTCVPHYKLPPENATGSNDLRFRQYHYLAMCYARMNQFAEKRKIKNRLAYLCKIIKSDIEVNG